MAKFILNRKLIKELEHGDRLYYPDPKNPEEIKDIFITKVEPTPKPQYYMVSFLEAANSLQLISPKDNAELAEEINRLPTKQVLVRGDKTSFLASTWPPNMYFTTKAELEEWMRKL